MTNIRNVYFLFLVALALKTSHAAKNEDLITSLPGLDKLPSFKMYSGYLDVSPNRHFFYWFVTSQNKPQTDPVVLWLNGGPGCSSMDGLLSENGPVHVNNDGESLKVNPYSWNKIANVLYLESPAGVGYSYDQTGNYHTSDKEVAVDNHLALIDFFKKFPEFLPNPFYIFGESYGGVYAPTLGVEIMEGSVKINFQGMGIGNGVTSSREDQNSYLFYAYYHGLIGFETWKEVTSLCCNGAAIQGNCDFYSNKNMICRHMVKNIRSNLYNMGLNRYSIYRDCHTDLPAHCLQYTFEMRSKLGIDETQTMQINQNKTFLCPVDSNLNHNLPCVNTTAETNWLNSDNVRKALHVVTKLPKWTVCSDMINYKQQYTTMAPQYLKLLQLKNFRILVYNGDVDLVCNFLGNDWFLHSLKMGKPSTQVPWYVDGQVAGFVKHYKQVVFTTIRGAGHMVPQWAPSYAFAMFEKFLNSKPFE